MVYKKHTRNQKRMYRIYKMEEQIEKDKYIIGKQQQELDKYKNRIDKAIEYIKNKTKNEVTFDNDKLIDVLNILQGSDE